MNRLYKLNKLKFQAFFSCLSCFIQSKKQNHVPANLRPSIIRWEDTTEFKFPITEGDVIKVYDGDTFTIASKMPYEHSPLYRFSVRLRGIDAPEMISRNEDEKIMALEARNALANMILHKKVLLKKIENEKYGRILADVYLEDCNINQWLLEERYAIPYEGRTKHPPKSWLHYRHTGEFL